MSLKAEYDRDFYVWTRKNVELLRSGKVAQVDIEHIAEELESMGKRDLRQLRSRLQVLVMHLLKWKYQPERQGKSWVATIEHQRDEIEGLLLDSPSLRGELDLALGTIYPKAVRDACRETDLPETIFPTACPFLMADILAEGFLRSEQQNSVESFVWLSVCQTDLARSLFYRKKGAIALPAASSF